MIGEIVYKKDTTNYTDCITTDRGIYNIRYYMVGTILAQVIIEKADQPIWSVIYEDNALHIQNMPYSNNISLFMGDILNIINNLKTKL